MKKARGKRLHTDPPSLAQKMQSEKKWIEKGKIIGK